MKKLTANWGLKLASLIFAAIVWFLITNINDPVTSVRYTNIPVTLKNTSLITEQGQVYTILDGSDTINSVTLYAPRSIIDSLSQNNIVATADIQVHVLENGLRAEGLLEPLQADGDIIRVYLYVRHNGTCKN